MACLLLLGMVTQLASADLDVFKLSDHALLVPLVSTPNNTSQTTHFGALEETVMLKERQACIEGWGTCRNHHTTIAILP